MDWIYRENRHTAATVRVSNHTETATRSKFTIIKRTFFFIFYNPFLPVNPIIRNTAAFFSLFLRGFFFAQFCCTFIAAFFLFRRNSGRHFVHVLQPRRISMQIASNKNTMENHRETEKGPKKCPVSFELTFHLFNVKLRKYFQ